MAFNYSDKRSGIYQITNIVNGHFYNGSASNFSKRWGNHIAQLRKGEHHNRYLQRAYNKYGEENFTAHVVEYVDDVTKLIEREQHYIDTLKPQYNANPIAGSRLGSKASEESRKKMSIAQTGRKASAETLKKLSRAKSKENLSAETLEKLREANRGSKSPGAKLNEEEVFQIKTMLVKTKNIPYSKIAKQFNVDDETVGKIAREETWEHLKVDGWKKINRDTRKLTVDDVIEIKKMLLVGETLELIAEQFKVGTSIISSIQHGKKWTKVNVEGFKPFRKQARITEEIVRDIRNMLEEGKLQKEIAKHFGISGQSVSAIKTGVMYKNVK